MNGIIIIDKAPDWTSNDVVSKLRGILRERRIGHGGTLDPMATGVLPVFVGRATRAVEFCESFDKEYVAGVRLGITTDTQDTTGAVLERRPADVSPRDMENALARFRGELLQIPPMYSALKVGGKKLYELARRGVEIERRPRPITIYELELVSGGGSDYVLRIVCSKGTYIRTLAHDVGQALGCGGAMSSLRRTRAGEFSISDAVSLDEALLAAAEGRAEELLRPVDTLFAKYPAVTISDADEKKCRNGAAFPCPGPDGRYRAYSKDGSFLMLGELQNGVMSTIKSFYEV